MLSAFKCSTLPTVHVHTLKDLSSSIYKTFPHNVKCHSLCSSEYIILNVALLLAFQYFYNAILILYLIFNKKHYPPQWIFYPSVYICIYLSTLLCSSLHTYVSISLRDARCFYLGLISHFIITLFSYLFCENNLLLYAYTFQFN